MTTSQLHRRDGALMNWAILATLGLIWGASFLGVELALTGFGPVTIAAGRVSVAALILVSCALAFGDGLPGLWSHDFDLLPRTSARYSTLLA